MQQVLLIVQILVAVALVGIILLQQGRGADAGAAFGSGGSGALFGSRGPATFLSRMTAVLAAVFFVNSLALGYVAGQGIERRSVVEQFDAPPVQSVPEDVAAPAVSPSDLPDLPTAPVAGGDMPAVPEQPAGQGASQ